MANRFLETNYYKSPFVRSLKGSLKSLYSFIICDCTAAGIWSLDLEAAAMYIGFSVSFDEFSEIFVSHGKSIDIGKGKYFFPDFIEHQYPSGLQDWNKSHKKIIVELNKLGFLNSEKAEKGIVFFAKKEGASKGLQSSPNRTQGNGNGIGHGKEIGSENAKKIANEVWEDQIWREQICMGLTLKPEDLKKWMAMFNSSVSNDFIPNFNKSAYKKMIRGWIEKQKGKGVILSNGIDKNSNSAPLKQLNQ